MNDDKIDGTNFFTRTELACKHCGAMKFHPGFIDRLHLLRATFNEGMMPTNCCRCAEHNAAVGGHPHSMHVCDTPYWAIAGQQGTLALDVVAPDGPYRARLFCTMWSLGWSIGWGNGFLHGDMRILLPGFNQTQFKY